MMLFLLRFTACLAGVLCFAFLSAGILVAVDDRSTVLALPSSHQQKLEVTNMIIEGAVKRGELYYAKLPHRGKSVQRGIRPVLVIQADSLNEHSLTVMIAPLTSKQKRPDIRTHVPIVLAELPVPSQVLLEQIQTIPKRDLGQFIGTISNHEMTLVESAIMEGFGIYQ